MEVLEKKDVRRRYLPNFAILDDYYDFDQEKLLQSYYHSIEANKKNKLNHHLSINAAEDDHAPLYYGTDKSGYEQLNLTSYDLVDTSEGYIKANWQWFSRSDMSAKDRRSHYRKNLHNTRDAVNPSVETSYTKINQLSDSYMKKILSKFKGRVTRVRWAVANPGMKLKPHFDYDTVYAVRYHLPVLTNPDAVMCIERDGKIQKVHAPVDGRTWFLNQGWKHWIENNGNTPRVHLIVSVIGQQDTMQMTEVS